MEKYFKKVLLYLILGVFITGCGKVTSFPGMGREHQESIKKKEANGERIKITWWAFPTFAQLNSKDPSGTYEKMVIDAFQRQNPDIKVELEMLDFSTGALKLSRAIKSGTNCDVLFDAPGRIIGYANQGKLVPLDDLFTDEFYKDVENEAIIKACKADGIPYMYPLSSAPFYMVFNKQMLKEAGVLDLVKTGWTTEDFTTVIEALKKAGFVPGSIFCNSEAGDQGTRAFAANLFDSPITDEKASTYVFDNENAVKSLTYIQEVVKKGWMLNGSLNNGSQDIMNFIYGKSSFTLLWGPSQYKMYHATLDKNDIDLVEVPFPSADGIPKLEYLINGFCVFDNKDQDKIDASIRFIKFLCDDPVWGSNNVTHTGCIPVRSRFYSSYESKNIKEIASWTQYYETYYNNIENFSDMRVYWFNMLQGLLNDNLDPLTAAKEFVHQCNYSLSKIKDGKTQK